MGSCAKGNERKRSVTKGFGLWEWLQSLCFFEFDRDGRKYDLRRPVRGAEAVKKTDCWRAWSRCEAIDREVELRTE